MIIVDLLSNVALDPQGVRRKVVSLQPLVLSSRSTCRSIESRSHDLVFYPETLEEAIALAEDVYGLIVRLRTSLTSDCMTAYGCRLTYENRAASWVNHATTYSTRCWWQPTSLDQTKMFCYHFQDGAKWIRQSAISSQGPYHVVLDKSWLPILTELWAPDSDR